MPTEPEGIESVIQQARHWLLQRQAARAVELLSSVVQSQPARLDAWLLLAMASRSAQDPAGELRALNGALAADPYDLFALLLKGDCLDRLGRGDEALAAHRAACAVADGEDSERLGVDVQRLLRKARTAVNRSHRALSDSLDALLRAERVGEQGHAGERFARAVDLMLGRRQRFDPQPMGLYYPQLLQAEFFPRERFPWLTDLEAHTPQIQAELQAVLAQETGFEPYVQYTDDQPVAQWAELNRSPQWNAFHLIKEGEPVKANAERCPHTMSILARLPQPKQTGRTPVAMFSCLKPNTRIPPHVGTSNARLLVHLPLLVPPQCGFRVGSETRPWRVGEALVFDDTVEHEAWNLSDELRVVLIFDIWHPDLSPLEQAWLGELARVEDSRRSALRQAPQGLP